MIVSLTTVSLAADTTKKNRSHEKVWLSLLKHGRLLVLKDGIHQFMFQPGAVTEFRKQAHSFAAAAFESSSTETGTEAAQSCEVVKPQSQQQQEASRRWQQMKSQSQRHAVWA